MWNKGDSWKSQQCNGKVWSVIILMSHEQLKVIPLKVIGVLIKWSEKFQRHFIANAYLFLLNGLNWSHRRELYLPPRSSYIVSLYVNINVFNLPFSVFQESAVLKFVTPTCFIHEAKATITPHEPLTQRTVVAFYFRAFFQYQWTRRMKYLMKSLRKYFHSIRCEHSLCW